MNTSAVGNLARLLNDSGYRVGDLTNRLWAKGVCVSFQTVYAYCRASDKSYGKPEVWAKIEECLQEMGVQWDAAP